MGCAVGRREQKIGGNYFKKSYPNTLNEAFVLQWAEIYYSCDYNIIQEKIPFNSSLTEVVPVYYSHTKYGNISNMSHNLQLIDNIIAS